MLIILLLGIHFLLLSIYAIAIELKISRHQLKYILFAAVIPIAGEICLFVTEFVKTKSEYDINNMFYYVKKDMKHNVMQEELNINQINRESLIFAIEKHPTNIVDILKRALLSDDVEVVHVAAASIMKIQREYENKIKESTIQYEQMPQNMEFLRKCISLIGDYYKENILNGASADLLLQQQETLLLKMIDTLPKDWFSNISLVQNYYLQKKYEEAYIIIENARRFYNNEFEIWKWEILIQKERGNIQEIMNIVNESKYVQTQWSNENILWWEKECGKIVKE